MRESPWPPRIATRHFHLPLCGHEGAEDKIIIADLAVKMEDLNMRFKYLRVPTVTLISPYCP
jgi:hypothetical protein